MSDSDQKPSAEQAPRPAAWEARMLKAALARCPANRPADRCCRRHTRRFDRRMGDALARALDRARSTWER